MVVCPNCGNKTHRSHSRGIMERFRKRFGAARFYRCSHCGWRGRMQPEEASVPTNRRLTFLIWGAGVLLALALAYYFVGRMNSSIQPPPTTDAAEPQ